VELSNGIAHVCSKLRRGGFVIICSRKAESNLLLVKKMDAERKIVSVIGFET
jgi:mRNA-degrading endonuclease RelE of RelBE toxin-antitoxin system